jgi:hypothetical protein
MHTTHDTAANLRRQPPRRLPLYYLGRKAEVRMVACERPVVHPGADALAP